MQYENNFSFITLYMTFGSLSKIIVLKRCCTVPYKLLYLTQGAHFVQILYIYCTCYKKCIDRINFFNHLSLQGCSCKDGDRSPLQFCPAVDRFFSAVAHSSPDNKICPCLVTRTVCTQLLSVKRKKTKGWNINRTP